LLLAKEKRMRRCRTGQLWESLETRRLLSASPLAINFGDEAMWGSNFNAAATQAKQLGVQAVRLWIGLDSYDARPNAWDSVPAFGYGADGKPQVGNPARTMARAFELSRMGFKVLLVLNNNTGSVPDGPDQVRGLVRHLMNSTETPDSTTTLANIVDQWEIGNEVDQSYYWQPSGSGKVAGLTSYVDNFLIPAADELHSAEDPANWEQVVSAGVSYNPADVKTILDVLAARNALADVDFVGFHPYAAYDASNPSVNPIRDNTLLARSYADAVGKSMIATEWNVRGFGNTGANDAKWAKSADEIYRTVIAPNFSSAYYFGLINNWAARGGTVSARPGGVLKHDTTLSVTPTSSLADLEAYYTSPLVPADPFYGMFNGWQSGQISGRVITTAGLPNSAIPTATVFIDANNNGTLDDGELSTTTDATGGYSLKYASSNLPAGEYTLRVLATGDYETAGDGVTVSLASLSNQTGVNFTVQPTAEALAAIGVVSGTLKNESENSAIIGGTVWLDLNNDGVVDANEPSTVTGNGGAFSILFDTRVVGTGDATLRAVLNNGLIAGATPTVTLLAGQTQTGLSVGVRRQFGSISGYLFNDGNADGLMNNGDTYTGARVVFLDANGNGKLDLGERQMNSDASGNYRFDNLPAGTYNVYRVFPSGYRLSTGSNGKLTVILNAGQNATGVNLGTTNLPAPTAPTVPTTPTTPTVPTTPTTPTTPTVPTNPTPPVTPAGQASIAGKVFPQASKWNAAAAAASWTVFLDTNKNGQLDAGEIYTAAKSDLTYAFSGLAAGTYTVALKPPAGWAIASTASKTFTITLKATTVKTGQNFVVVKN
jgi:hypothetical protein